MKRVLVLALCASAALAACSKKEEFAAEAPAAPAAEAAADIAAPAPPPADAAASPARTEPAASEARQRADVYTPPVNVPLLAYAYRYQIEAPAKSIDLLVAKHEAACQAAGPSLCQVTQANVRHASKRDVTGTLSLRARPDWMATFRSGLAADAEGAGGKISNNSTGTDDLSVSMVDTDAAIRAKMIERDRLEDLLRRRTGKLADIMEVEQHLAEVRGEIDAAQSALTMMKARVRMSQITINYGPKGGLATDGAWEPVGDAIRASQGLMATVVSVLIMLTAGFAPIAAVGGAIWLGVRRLRKPRGPAAQTGQSAPATP